VLIHRASLQCIVKLGGVLLVDKQDQNDSLIYSQALYSSICEFLFLFYF
jgi:hypothetical protein